MLYVHTLQLLNPKTIELESIPIVRELKQKKQPINEDTVKARISSFFVTEEDMKVMELASAKVDPTLTKVKSILSENDSIHEQINLARTVQILEEMPNPLQNSMQYAESIEKLQAQLPKGMAELLTKIPSLKTREEKIVYNNKLSEVFQELLRNNQFMFDGRNVVNEGRLNHIRDLRDNLDKGFIFHFTLENELKKQNFEAISSSLPKEKLDQLEELKEDIDVIKEGIERAYDINMRMISVSIILYAYVKWVNGG